jgi:6-phosphogluconolactonase
MVILGLGEDGHTASIFPGHLDLFASEKICEVTAHPVTNRQRVTLTGKVINNADVVVFLVTGRKKAAIVEKIVHKDPSSLIFPAAYIKPVYGELTWFIDEEAGSLL